jgi:hypothetical protein
MHCGADNPEDAKFCKECGKLIKKAVTDQADPIVTSVRSLISGGKVRDKPIQVKWKGIILAAAITLTLLLVDFLVINKGKLPFSHPIEAVAPVYVASTELVNQPNETIVPGIVERAPETSRQAQATHTIVNSKYTIYFLTGHGEYPIIGGSDKSFTRLAGALQLKNYTVNTLNLLATGKIPDDASVIIVDGPKKPLSDTEVSLLDQYLTKGGSVIVMEDPAVDTQFGDAADPLANDLVKTYGIDLGNNMVVDVYGYQAFQNPYFAVSNSYATHAITQKMSTMGTGFQNARSVTADSSVGTSYSKTQLVLTVDQSWAETDMTSIQNGSAKYDQVSDLVGPVSMVIVAEDSSTNARLVVFGDSDFATNAYYSFYGNSDLIINSIEWASKGDSYVGDNAQILGTPISTNTPGALYELGVLDLNPPTISANAMTTGTGLVYEDLHVGEGETAKSGDVASVNYTGWLQNGTKFDSSIDRGQAFEFKVGAGYVIAGWDEGVVGMRIGGTRLLVIPPSLGYGSQTQGIIPANSVLIFEIQLIDIKK